VIRRLLFLLPFVAATALTNGCPPPVTDDDDTGPECTNPDAPVVLGNEVEDGQPVGFAVQVVAQATDDDGISTVSLYYRTEGQSGFTFTFMSNEGTGDPSIYVAEIPASVVQDPGVDYYVRATDSRSGCQEESFWPDAGESEPLNFQTQLDLQPLPFYEFFEAGDCSGEGADPEDIGWAGAIESFPQGIHAWRLSDRSPLSGSCAAFHSEGIPGGFWDCPPPDGTGTIERQNWLISPPVDMSGKADIFVRWFERHLTAGTCAEVHGLYVSVGSPDPSVGDYVAVSAELPFPGEAWTSSDWYDLSEFAGAERAYVALYYQGGAAGRWQIDDLYIGEPLADLQLDSAGPLDGAVGPGSSNVELDVTIVNVSDDYGAGALTGVLSTADPQLTVSGGTQTFGAVAPGASVDSDGPFLFDVSGAHADNAYLDFALTLDDGEGHTWTIPIRLLMGEESTLVVEYDASGGAELQLELGHGPIAAPDFAVQATSVDLAGADWELTLTEQATVLPPGPGSFRWHLEATASGTTSSTLEDVVFTVGGVEYTADADDVPVELAPGESVTLQIPPPPVLIADSWGTTPDPVGPGASVALSSLLLRNDGATTAGPVGCVLGSSSSDATGFDTAPVTFGDDPIASGEAALADGEFHFDIAAGHNDDSSIPLTLLCTDGADTLTSTFELPVPYAHPVVGSIRIDDSDFDEDGLADPGETVEVFITALNAGSVVTDGDLTVEVAQGVGSTAPDFLVGVGTRAFPGGPLDPGAEVESAGSFEIGLGEDNRLGDSVVLDLTWEAGDDTWTETLVVEVTGKPWTDCPEAPDPEGDVLNGQAFDIAGCAYRSDGEMLQVRLDSYTPFPADIAFVDFFFYEVPSLYSVETIGGVADFESGCVFGSDLEESEPIAVEFAGNSITARVLLDDLAEIGGNVQVAFGAGSCPDVYFCDTYPPGALLFNIEEGQYNCDGGDFIPLNW